MSLLRLSILSLAVAVAASCAKPVQVVEDEDFDENIVELSLNDEGGVSLNLDAGEGSDEDIEDWGDAEVLATDDASISDEFVDSIFDEDWSEDFSDDPTEGIVEYEVLDSDPTSMVDAAEDDTTLPTITDEAVRVVSENRDPPSATPAVTPGMTPKQIAKALHERNLVQKKNCLIKAAKKYPKQAKRLRECRRAPARVAVSEKLKAVRADIRGKVRAANDLVARKKAMIEAAGVKRCLDIKQKPRKTECRQLVREYRELKKAVDSLRPERRNLSQQLVDSGKSCRKQSGKNFVRFMNRRGVCFKKARERDQAVLTATGIGRKN